MDGKYELDAAKISNSKAWGFFSLFLSLNRSNLVFEEQINSPKRVLNFNKNPKFDAKASEVWKVRCNNIVLQNSLEVSLQSTRKCWLFLLAYSHLLV